MQIEDCRLNNANWIPRTVLALLVVTSALLAAGKDIRGNAAAGVVTRPALRPAQSLLPVSSATSASDNASPVRLVSSDARQVTFEVTADSFAVEPTAAGVSVRAAGFFGPAEPGRLDLPERIVLVGLPQDGDVRLSATAEETDVKAGLDVRMAPEFTSEKWSSGPVVQRPSDGQGAGMPAEVLSIERLRDVRVARVRVSPAQYDAATRELRLSRRVRVSLSFSRPGVAAARPDPMDNVISGMLVNGAQALDWKLDAPMPDSVNFFSRSDVWVKVQTETTGIYRVTPADLKTAGFDPATIDPATLKLYGLIRHTQNGPYGDTIPELSVYVSDNGDGKFTGSEYVAFYAEAPSYWQQADTAWQTNPLTRYGCYWLTWGGAQGRRMDTVSGAGAVNPRATAFHRVRIEDDELCPSRSGLLWLWQNFYKASGATPVETSLVLPLQQRDTVLRIAGRLYGRYHSTGTVPYPIRLLLNGVLLDTVIMSAQASTPPPCDFSFSSLAPAFAARPGLADTFTFNLYPDLEEDMFLDYLEVDYAERLKLTSAEPYIEFSHRDAGPVDYGIEGVNTDALLLNVSDPESPVRVTDGQVTGGRLDVRLDAPAPARFACVLPGHLRAPVAVTRRSPGNWRAAGATADYYIICPDGFYEVGQQLAHYRAGNVAGLPGARVEAVKLSELYDDYAFGWEEPGAIKEFLKAKRPSYVLLAGDGTYDYRNILKFATGPSLPPYELGYDIDPEVYGRTAKALDAWYADLEGSGNSPDLILGRVTSKSAVEFRTFVDKVKRYESQPPGFWAKRFILLSDDEYLGSVNDPDPIGFEHIYGNEAMATRAGSLLDPVKIYLTEWSLGDRGQSAVALSNELNRGALFWCFYGHGAGFQLCHEKALEIARVDDIRNDARTPLAFFGSCGVGRFDDTRYEAIAEELVRFRFGCIATVGATKATESGGNEALANILFPQLMSQPGMPIGPAFYSAYTQSNTLYHLFGDPATVLRTPLAGAQPVAVPDTFYPGGRVAVTCAESVPSGSFGMTANEATWFRSYHSTAGGVNYRLPGYEVGRGQGSFDSGTVATSFVVPRINYPDTTAVGDGYYARLPNSCRVSTLAWKDAQAWSNLVDDIPLSHDTVTKTDNTPPDIALYADGIRLLPAETTAVPAGFTLEAIASDPSGILVIPLPDVMLSLALDGARTDMTPFFQYDKNSTTTGRFQYPVKLTKNFDSLTVVASDNAVDPSSPGSNRRSLTVKVRTRTDERLQIDSCLVYPNPTTGSCEFTFNLSRSASVTARVFTISGRLVRSLSPQACGFGFNRIAWDGCDTEGRPLANGIYLYRLQARVSSGTQNLTAAFTDKLVVYR